MGVSEIIRRKQQDLIRAKIEGIIQCIQEGESIPEECSFEEYEICMLEDMLIEAGLEEGKDYLYGAEDDGWEPQFDKTDISIVVDDIYIGWRTVGHRRGRPDVSTLEKREAEERSLVLDLKKIGIDIEIPQGSLAKKLTELRAKEKEEYRQERQKVKEEEKEVFKRVIANVKKSKKIPEGIEVHTGVLEDVLEELGFERDRDFSGSWARITVKVDGLFITFHDGIVEIQNESEYSLEEMDLERLGIKLEDIMTMIEQSNLEQTESETPGRKDGENYEYDDDDIQALDEDTRPQENLRQKFEGSLLRDDVVEYYLSRTPGELEAEFGPEVARMVCFEQKNSHHCYDLWEHTLRTVEGIKAYGLTPEQFKKLRVAAFFHDIGKPDVSKFNEKTGQQVFYGHAMHSVDVARPILEKLGYSEQEIAQLSFFIGHHDDFISYKTKLEPFMRHHEFIRGIEPATVAEKVIENKFDFGAMGYNEDQIRAICSTLAHGKKPDFRTKKGPIVINVNMDDVQAKIDSGEYDSHYDASLEDYQMLLQLCKADAGAQSEVAMQNGRVVGSKTEKLENMSNIESSIPEAYRLASEKSRSEFLTNIVRGATQKVALRDQNDKAAQFTQDMQAKLPKENPSLGDN